MPFSRLSRGVAGLVVGLLLGFAAALVMAQSPTRPSAPALTAPEELTGVRLAQQHFYSGRYDEAIELAGTLRASGTDGLAAYELRTSALHFKIKRLVGDASDKGKAFKQCEACLGLQAEFLKDTAAGKSLAKARLQAAPQDEAALFFLGKFDLNYIWLQLATLGKRTGWSEYWDARRTLDAVLKMNPANVRARAARAWIDYIVDTRVPFGLQWMLGGGDKKRALKNMREASGAEGDLFVRAEAGFAFWEMLQREESLEEALGVAKRLAQDFPDNQELQRFIKTSRKTAGAPQK